MIGLRLLACVLSFLRPAITPIKTNPNNLQNIEQDGALIPNGALLPALQSITQNAAPAFGNTTLTRVPSIVTARTYTGNEMVGGWIRREHTTTYTDCTDTATNIVNAIPGATVGQTFQFWLANCGPGTATLAAGTGVTLTGSAVISGLSARLFQGQVLGSGAVTLTNFMSFNAGGGTQFL